MGAIAIIVISIVCVLCLFVMGNSFVKLVKEFVINEQKKTILEIQKISEKEVRKTLTPIQLQAYERLVLFLERIKPDNLIRRCFQTGMDAKLLKDVMIKNIENEYEHNLSQQLYISSECWLRIKNAKEDLINTLNVLTNKIDEKTTPTSFAGEMFEHLSKGANQIDLAQEFLKQEIQTKFQ
ncbi:MAG: hypothetical protein Q4Q06_00685 [Bacteroidota bacterium]|nr:hypothetical protein [Bacteroidota bacterium]